MDTVETAVYKLGLDDSQYTAAASRAAAANEKLASSGEAVSVSEEKVTRATRSTEEGYRKLIAALDPAVKANMEYERTVQRVNRFQEEGVISARERAAAIGLAGQKYQEAIERINRGSSSAGDVVADFGEKFSSAASTISSVGGKALGAASQRVEELTSKFAQSGRLLSAGVTALLNPTNLLAVGFAAVTVAAVAFYSAVSDRAPTIEQALETQVRLIGQVKDAYSDAAKSAETFGAAQRDVAIVQQMQALAKIRDELQKESGKALLFMMPDAGFGTGDYAISERFDRFAQAINGLNEGWAKGAPDLQRYREQVAQLALANPELNKLANELLTATDKAAKLFGEAQAGQALLDVLRGIADEAARARVGLAAAADPLEDLRKKTLALANLAPEANKGLLDSERIRDANRKYVELVQSINAVDSPDRVLRLAEAEKLHAAALAEVNKEKEKEVDQYTRALEQVGKNIAMREAEAKAVGKSAGEHDKLVTQARLLEAAQQAGRTVTAEMTKQIEEYGDRAKAAGDKLAQLRVMSDVKFTSDTMFLGEADKRIASILRQVHGDDWKNMMNGPIAGAIRFNDAMQTVKDTITQFAQTFINSLVQGQSLTKSLSASWSQLSQTMLNSAIQNPTTGGQFGWIPAIASTIGSTLFGRAQQERQQNFQNMISGADRAQQFKLRGIATEPDSLAKRLHEFDERANQERVEEARKGNQARKELEEALFRERLQVIQDFNDELVAKEKAAEQERIAIHEAFFQRFSAAQDRLLAATTDSSTLEGQLILFDRKVQREREDEIRAGGQALVELEAAQAAERLNIEKSFQEKSVEEAKRAAQEKLDAETRAARGIVDYVNSLRVGPESSLAPAQRLSAAQSTYNSILALAQQGNADALGRITSDFENLRRAAQAYYGSSSGYQNILSTGITQLTNLPGVASSTNDVVAAVRDVVTAVNSTTTAANQTKAAVDADKIATTDKLSEAIGNLATVINRLDQSLVKLSSNDSSLDAIETFSNRMINAFNGLGQLTANFARSNHDENNIIMDKLGKIPNNSPAQGGGGQSVWDWLGFAAGGTLPAGRIGIMGEHHPDGPFVVQAGANPIPITPAMPSFANDNSAILDAILAEQRATRRVLAAVGAALVNAEHQTGRELAESIRETIGGLEQSQAREARHDRMRRAA